LFLCDESAVDNSTFISILTALMSADQGYISMAKSMISGEFPGPVAQEMGNMLRKMISSFSHYNLTSPRKLISLWLEIIVLVPDWSSNTSALYLLDILCSYSFFDPVIHSETLLFAKNIHKENINNETGSGFISWITGINYSGYKLIFSTSGPKFPFFAFFILQAEDCHIRDTGLWTEIVMELSRNKTLEESLASAASKCQASPPLSNQLPVYRWVQQALDTPISHPLQPILWQKFFHCFLSRPTPLHEGEEPRGVGMCFFTGMINSLYLKKMKNFVKSLQEYQEKQDRKSNPVSENLSKIYKSFYIWLDESKILDSTLYIPALSPVYEPDKLAQILTGDGTLWLEYIDNDAVHCQHSQSVNIWDKNHFRQKISKETMIPFNSDSNLTPTERIIKRLQSYESRLLPPINKRETKPILQIPMSTIVCEEALLHFLDSPLGVMNEMSRNFSSNTLAYGSLNCSFLELLPMLWKDEEVETLIKKACPGTKRGKEKIECCGSAKILLKYSEAKTQDDIAVKLENNRKDWETVETRLLAPPSHNFVTAAYSLNSVCNKILRLYEKDLGRGQRYKGIHHSLALAVFYKVASCITEDWLVCPSLRNFISDTLELLASVVVSSTPGQAPKILEVLIKSPHLSPFLSQHFSPNVDDSNEVIHIYNIISNLPDGDGALPFVLLSKLDMKKWLTTSPSARERSELLSIIATALARTGPDPDQSREMLHGLQRKHLFQIFREQNQYHYLGMPSKETFIWREIFPTSVYSSHPLIFSGVYEMSISCNIWGGVRKKNI